MAVPNQAAAEAETPASAIKTVRAGQGAALRGSDMAKVARCRAIRPEHCKFCDDATRFLHPIAEAPTPPFRLFIRAAAGPQGTGPALLPCAGGKPYLGLKFADLPNLRAFPAVS